MKTKFGYNADVDKSDWVRIQFVGLTKKQMKYLHKAEAMLLKAGVTFDTGYNFETATRDWEFDWALEGAKVNVKSKPKKTDTAVAR